MSIPDLPTIPEVSGQSKSSMKYHIMGTVQQTLAVDLQPNQVVFSDTGAMSWMTSTVTMNTKGSGGLGGTPAAVPAAMPINAEQALKAAQDYLDVYMTGTVTAEKADPFYGYYTIDILRNGKITGMLSVNGYYGQVFFHTWHGDFIEMAEQ